MAAIVTSCPVTAVALPLASRDQNLASSQRAAAITAYTWERPSVGC